MLPNGLFRVDLESGHQVRAHLGALERAHLGRILVGDRVIVRLSPQDLGRGRIIARKSSQ